MYIVKVSRPATDSSFRTAVACSEATPDVLCLSARLWGDQSDAPEETEVYDGVCELSIKPSIYLSVRE